MDSVGLSPADSGSGGLAPSIRRVRISAGQVAVELELQGHLFAAASVSPLHRGQITVPGSRPLADSWGLDLRSWPALPS